VYEIVIREKAGDDLENIYSWIANENPRAAVKLVRRLRDRIAWLGTPGLSHMGRPRSVPAPGN
jgi:plasmid stabilization system protein ParE